MKEIEFCLFEYCHQLPVCDPYDEPSCNLFGGITHSMNCLGEESISILKDLIHMFYSVYPVGFRLFERPHFAKLVITLSKLSSPC